jgi:hypothetical protein
MTPDQEKFKEWLKSVSVKELTEWLIENHDVEYLSRLLELLKADEHRRKLS